MALNFAARAEGIDARGPISADTLFYRAYSGEFDLIVAQYHDQGHIAAIVRLRFFFDRWQ